MQPVRVKYYGLLSLTRRRYLTIQAVLLVAFIVVITIWAAQPMPEELQKAPPHSLKTRLFRLLWDSIPWLAAAALVLEGIETVFMLRKFARKEAEQLAGPPETDTTAGPDKNLG